MESTNPSEDDNESTVTNDDWTEDEHFEKRLAGKIDTLFHLGDGRSSQKKFSFAPGENQTPLG